jgi:hypothetical protein
VLQDEAAVAVAPKLEAPAEPIVVATMETVVTPAALAFAGRVPAAAAASPNRWVMPRREAVQRRMRRELTRSELGAPSMLHARRALGAKKRCAARPSCRCSVCARARTRVGAWP